MASSDKPVGKRRFLWLAGIAVALIAVSGCGSDGPTGPLRLADSGASYDFDGWGVSLAWWANVIGAGEVGVAGSGSAGCCWTPADRDLVLKALFGDPGRVSESLAQLPIQPLGLNVLRYNIGASPAGAPAEAVGELPSDCRSFRAGGLVPSPVQAAGANADLANDPRQVDVLVRAKALIDGSNAPGESTILEAFANAPPWWLTTDHCPAGKLGQPAFAGHPEAADAYARYLVDVLSAFRDQGLEFATVEPFNEPNEGWWGGCREKGGCQEGANFPPDAQREVVDALCPALAAAPELPTRLSANDENDLDNVGKSLPAWIHSGCLAQVNVHGYDGLKPYDGGKRADARAAVAGHPLWMSEFGVGPCDGEGAKAESCSGLTLAKQVADDLQYLRPRAWVYWQALESANGGWGLLQDSRFPDSPARNGDLYPTPRFWVLAQYTRYIRGGSKIYPLARPSDELKPGAPDPRVVVAKNGAGQIVVVATNAEDREQPLSLSLAPLATQGEATPHRLSLPGSGPAVATLAPITLKKGMLDDALPPATVTTYTLGSASGVPLSSLHRCGTPKTPGEGPFEVRAVGVSCRYARTFALGSRLCRLRYPTARASCTDAGWECRMRPADLERGGGIPAACTKGRARISWRAGY